MASQSSAYTPGADRFGVFASATCALHCLASALIPGLLATAGLSSLMSEETENVMVGLALLGALLAAIQAWRRTKRKGAVVVLAVGAACLLAARFMEHFGGGYAHAMSIGAAVILVSGHVWNLRARPADDAAPEGTGSAGTGSEDTAPAETAPATSECCPSGDLG